MIQGAVTALAVAVAAVMWVPIAVLLVFLAIAVEIQHHMNEISSPCSLLILVSSILGIVHESGIVHCYVMSNTSKWVVVLGWLQSKYCQKSALPPGRKVVLAVMPVPFSSARGERSFTTSKSQNLIQVNPRWTRNEGKTLHFCQQCSSWTPPYPRDYSKNKIRIC